HLDVADGIFTFNKTWNNPKKWQELNLGLNLEVHLMVEEPEEVVEDWLKAKAKRIIFHWEAVKLKNNPEEIVLKILNLCSKYGAQAMLSICMETPLEEIKNVLDKFKYFQILAVYPGPSGQKFLPEALPKIKFLKNLKPEAIIEVDGGINPEVLLKIKPAGADIAVSGSYIFNNADYKKAFARLVNI
ncbi:MAG: ribulose-phosphate 3-epimerase, partial [Minisyncoccia bacterium]